MTPSSYIEEEQQRSFEEQINRLKTQLKEAQAERERNKLRLEKLSVVVLEREKKITELQQYEYSFRKSNGQRQTNEALQGRYREELNQAKVEKENYRKELEESHQHSEQLQRVIRFLREKQEGAELETNQFQEEYHQSQASITEFTGKLKAVEDRNQELEGVVIQEQQARQDALEEVEALHKQFELLKKMLADSKMKCEKKEEEELQKQTLIDELKVALAASLEKNELQKKAFDGQLVKKEEELIRKKSDLEEAERRYQQSMAEKHHLQEAMTKAHSAKEEAESRLKMAQQHLAKKVKETSDLHDKAHSSDLLLQELQHHLDQSKERIAEQQLAIDAQVQQENRLKENLLESSKSAEAMAAKWEEKYFKIYEKWQENEVNLKELKKIEEKHSQLQALLSNIGSFLGANAGFSQPAAVPSQEIVNHSFSLQPEQKNVLLTEPQPCLPERAQSASPIHEESKIIETCVMKKPYQNLFDLPNQQKRTKLNFFE